MKDKILTLILLGVGALLSTSLLLQEESIGMNIPTFAVLPGLIGITLILFRKNYKN